MKWTKKQRQLYNDMRTYGPAFVARNSSEYPSFCGLVNRGHAISQPVYGCNVVEFRPVVPADPFVPYGRCFHCGDKLGSDGYIEHAPGVRFCGDNDGKCHEAFMEKAKRRDNER